MKKRLIASKLYTSDRTMRMFTTQHDRPFRLTFLLEKVLDKAEQVGVYFVAETNKTFVLREISLDSYASA